MIKTMKFAGFAVGVFVAASFSITQGAVDDGKTVGRVRVTTIHGAGTAAHDSVKAALAARFAPAAGKRFADRRIVSVRPRGDDGQQFEATIYDYTVEKTFNLVLDAKGRELSRKAVAEQPTRLLDELADAGAIVRENPAFSEAIAAGQLTIYEPMPGITVDADGRRLVNVGVISKAVAGQPLDKNEVVSVHIPTATVVRYASGAPATSRAQLLACGPASSGCSYNTGPCSYYQIQWPAADPVWKLKIRHPSCTSSVQGDGTGLEITDVYYRGRMVLKRAEVPVLNVEYVGNTCGPYRDWLFSEDCFQATGTDVPAAGSGVRVASAPPSTLCESGTPGSDAGNFKGVAIYDQGDSLLLMTETNAGWYRYVMEWRLYMDGSFEPIFGFGATSNSCTCNEHYHHAYWRMEWAIDAASDGTIDDPNTGIATLERRRDGTQDDYDPVTTEGTFLRPEINPDKDFFRIKNPATGNGYILEPGSLDGEANGDTYGKWDFAALALNSSQIDDPNTNTSVNVAPWVNGETLGTTKRLVTWYHATYDHHDPGGTGEPCELAGPKFVPLAPCAGSVSLNRTGYTCSSPVTVTVTDSDLAGTGTLNLAITSGTETTPEPIALTENPAGSGRFQATIPTYAGTPVTGDGKISVVNGDSISVQYVDASSCGSPNVPVTKTATVDCSAPAIANLHVATGTGSASITWDTSESANGIVHYGTTLPAGSSSTATGFTSHASLLTGLADCTTYYYWVESTDAVGNTTASNAGGGYFAFTTAQTHRTTYASSGPPISIPDNNGTGATSTIAVAAADPVTDVNVTVNITHTYDMDLSLSLITPGSTTIPLSTRRGGSANNFTSTVFDDEATLAIGAGVAPFTGSFQPESPLAVADGASALGNWRFKVVDSAGQDVGTIDNWSLVLSYPDQACAGGGAPPPVPDGSFGTGMTASHVTGLSDGVHLTWDVGTCAAKNNHLLYGTLAGVSTYALAGSVCGLGPLGSYDWMSVPAGDLWFVVVGDDAAAKEGSWGTDGTGAQRNGAIASGQCGFTARDNSATCP